MAMTAEALTKKRSKQADAEEPTPLEAALLTRLPGAPAAHAPPPSSPQAPVRTAPPPPPAHPLRGRVHLSPIELMAHLHALLWKTPTSTQRLPCLPPSLPPGCSLRDDLLEEDGFDGGLMLGACVRTSQGVR